MVKSLGVSQGLRNQELCRSVVIFRADFTKTVFLGSSLER